MQLYANKTVLTKAGRLDLAQRMWSADLFYVVVL